MSDKKINLIIIFCVIIIGFLIYANSIGNPFIWDDNTLIAKNAFIKDFSNMGRLFSADLHHFGSMQLRQDAKIQYYRPVIALSFMIDYFLWGLDSRGYHITNILIHLFNAILIFFLARALVADKRVGIIASILFLTHPISTEAVTYISGRGDPLSLFFTISSLIFFIKQERSKRGILAPSNLFSAAFFTAALFTRENNLLFIFVLLIYTFIFTEHRSAEVNRRYSNLLPHIAITAVFIIFRIGILGVSAPLGLIKDPIGIRLLTLPSVIAEYARILIFPVGLHMGRQLAPADTLLSPSFILPLSVISVIFFLFKKTSKGDRFLLFAAAWTIITFLPFSSMLYPLTTYIAEHWLYIPFVGICLIFGRYIIIYADRHRSSRLITCLLIAILAAVYITCSMLTIDQNNNWRDEEAFYKRAFDYDRTDYRLMINLASAKTKEGRPDEAIKLIEDAITIIPDAGKDTELGRYHFGIAYKAMGDAYKAKRDLKNALIYYKRAIEFNPAYGDAYNELGIIYSNLGKEEKAMESFRKSIEFTPDNWIPYANLGSYFMKRGDLKNAKEHWEKALELRPGFKDALNALELIKKRGG